MVETTQHDKVLLLEVDYIFITALFYFLARLKSKQGGSDSSN
jgi:hypothetical protein